MFEVVIPILVVAALVYFRVFYGYRVDASKYRYLGPAQVGIIMAVSDALFPEGGDVPQSGKQVNVVAYVDQYMGWHTPTLRTMMKLMFFLIEHAPLLFALSPRRMSSLSAAKRETYLESWETSRFYLRRMVFQSLRATMCMAYMSSPGVREAMGIYRPAACQENAVVQ